MPGEDPDWVSTCDAIVNDPENMIIIIEKIDPFCR
jgi:hypothetical protein